MDRTPAAHPGIAPAATARTAFGAALALALHLAASPSLSATLHVWPGSPSDGPGTDWSNAFHVIQDAVDASVDGDTVLVTNGYYDNGGALTPGYGLSNRVCVTNAIILRSVNGPASTLIVGASHHGTNGPTAVRCAYLRTNAMLCGFTLTNGHTWASGGYQDERLNRDCGGGALLYEGGTLSNCTLTACSAFASGGGAECYFGGTLLACLVRGNTADSFGGGVAVEYAGGALSDCVLEGNWSDLGGGLALWINGGVARHCVFTNNEATSGGGAFIEQNCLLEHCLVVDNRAADAGGGVRTYEGGTLARCTILRNATGSEGGGIYGYNATVDSCLIAQNTAAGNGGGIWAFGWRIRNSTITSNSAELGGGIYTYYGSPRIANSIACHNTSRVSGPDIYQFGDPGIVSYTCSPGLSGGGNISSDPAFIDIANGNYHLAPSSPCLDSGDDASAQTDFDLDGQPRIFGPAVDMGCYERHVLHVSPSGGNAWPYTNWDTAALVIQTAVDASSDGDTVLVTNGFYATGGALTPGYGLSNRVCVTNAILLESVNGPEATLIVGAADSATGGLGSNAVRCAYVAGAATLSGFTLTNGHTWPEWPFFQDPDAPARKGGGAFLDQGGSLSNCALANNAAALMGGGAYLATGTEMRSCTLAGNSHRGDAGVGGGGAYCEAGSWVGFCHFVSNTALNGGGVAGAGTLERCTIRGNTASRSAKGWGGGAWVLNLGNLHHCVIEGNTAIQCGGGVFCFAGASLDSCLLVTNRCEVGIQTPGQDGGGGAHCSAGSTLAHCTLVGNVAAKLGGGVFAHGGSTQINCIAYYNMSLDAGSNIFSAGSATTILHTCSPDLTPGVDGNTTNAPMFADPAANDYRLLLGSPCIDAGTNLATVSDDLDGIPRPLDGDNDGFLFVDMGPYEFLNRSADSDRDGLFDADELGVHHTDPLNPNTDGDPQPDGREIVADTDPTDRGSFFRILALDANCSGLCTLSFPCSTARVYSVEWSEDLLGWSPVVGMTDMPGDASGLLSLSISNAAERAFFRATVGMP